MGHSREYDFVIFGATGFTGEYVVKEVRKFADKENIKWAVAGRSKDKLFKAVNQNPGSSGDSLADIIIADVSDYQSLLLMCKRARVVLDCVGPYRFFGEPVVKACVETETDFVDISGEPQYLENMVLKYSSDAEKANCYVVGACGFDSIPSDLGVAYVKQQFQGTLNGINGYLEFLSGPDGMAAHFGTYASAVHGVGDAAALRKLRKTFGHAPLPTVGPRLKLKGAVHYNSALGKYAIPFLGADASVVKRSQRYIHKELDEPPIQYVMYSCVNGLWSLFMLFFYGGIFKLLAGYSWGKSLLLNHPKFFTGGIFSHEGPTEKQLEQTSFSITMYGEGYSDGDTLLGRKERPDKKIVCKISGPEPAYVATPIVMVQSALAIVKERENLPPQGGVYSPGAAFYKTNLIKNLQKNGMRFEVIEQ